MVRRSMKDQLPDDMPEDDGPPGFPGGRLVDDGDYFPGDDRPEPEMAAIADEPAPEPDDPVPTEEEPEDLQHDPVTPPTVEPIAELEARRIAYDLAFCAFLGEVQNPPKRRRAEIRHKDGAGKHAYQYADLADVLATAKPILVKHGLGYTQDLVRDGTMWFVQTVLFHVAGHRELRGLYPVGSLSGDPKTFGAALTYARRYSLSLALGLASETDTDAGNGGNHTAYDRNPNAWRDEVQEERRPRQIADDGPPRGDYLPAPRDAFRPDTQRFDAPTSRQNGQNGRSAERYAPRDPLPDLPGEPQYDFLHEHMPTVSEFRRWLGQCEAHGEVYTGWTQKWAAAFKSLRLSEPLYQRLLDEANARRAVLAKRAGGAR